MIIPLKAKRAILQHYLFLNPKDKTAYKLTRKSAPDNNGNITLTFEDHPPVSLHQDENVEVVFSGGPTRSEQNKPPSPIYVTPSITLNKAPTPPSPSQKMIRADEMEIGKTYLINGVQKKLQSKDISYGNREQYIQLNFSDGTHISAVDPWEEYKEVTSSNGGKRTTHHHRRTRKGRRRHRKTRKTRRRHHRR